MKVNVYKIIKQKVLFKTIEHREYVGSVKGVKWINQKGNLIVLENEKNEVLLRLSADFYEVEPDTIKDLVKGTITIERRIKEREKQNKGNIFHKHYTQTYF